MSVKQENSRGGQRLYYDRKMDWGFLGLAKGTFLLYITQNH